MPEEYGGNGFNIFDGALASEELGYGCTGIGICIDASTLALTPMYLVGSDEQKKRFFGEVREKRAVAAYALTEPNAGSDVQGIRSQAIKKGDKYILNGHKRFITNAEVAEYITVFAMTDPERGSRSLSAFIVNRNSPGLQMVSRLDKMGQRASVQNEIKFENVEIPASNLLGSEGLGFVIAMKTFDRTRTGVAAAAVGNAHAAYEYSRDWAKNRIQFGHPVTALQGVSFMLADMATEIEAARMLVWRAAWAYDTQQKDFSKLSAMSKYLATDMAMKVTTDAVQVMGGEGYSKEHPVEKMMRDAKLSQIYEGTNQVNRLVVSKSILK
jgi:alkylation response protein AidB-like acyl-CoA dehydrogenase